MYNPERILGISIKLYYYYNIMYNIFTSVNLMQTAK